MEPPELCAVANHSAAYGLPKAWGWADARCGLRLPFLCKVAPAYQSYCRSEVTGHQYVLSTARSTWQQAVTACNTMGGHLVAYDNYTEQVGGGCRACLGARTLQLLVHCWELQDNDVP